MVEMNVKRRTDTIAERVLKFGQALGEVAHVMVVDERDGGHGIDRIAETRFRHLGAYEITKELGTGSAALVDDRVERCEKRGLHGNAEAHENVLHRGRA